MVTRGSDESARGVGCLLQKSAIIAARLLARSVGTVLAIFVCGAATQDQRGNTHRPLVALEGPVSFCAMAASQISFPNCAFCPTGASAVTAVVLNGCLKLATSSSPFRRFSRGSCFSNSRCAFPPSWVRRSPFFKVMTDRPLDAARFRVDSESPEVQIGVANLSELPESSLWQIGQLPIELWGRSGQRDGYDCFGDPWQAQQVA